MTTIAATPEEHLENGYAPATPAGDNLLLDYARAEARAFAEIAAVLDGRVADVEQYALHLRDSGLPTPFANAALLTRPVAEAEIDGLVGTTREFFGRTPGGPYMVFSPWPLADLAPHGFAPVGHPPLMLRAPGRDQHIVNVSAVEGQFYRNFKTTRHPHTNMAKAALNMMTLTSAKDYVQDGIHMNAVDTGWVTDEDPAQHAARKKDELDFQPPLDIVDGAARICDPFFAGLLTGHHVWGKFLKDYKPSAW